MKKKVILIGSATFLLAIIVIVVVIVCTHVHDIKGFYFDDEYHWNSCAVCKKKFDEEGHFYVKYYCTCGKIDPNHVHDYSSNFVCDCGMLDPSHTHEFSIVKSDDYSHSFWCVCGKRNNIEAHQITSNYESNADEHWQKCETCKKEFPTQPHQFDYNVCMQCKYVDVTCGLTYSLNSDDTYSVSGIGRKTPLNIVDIPETYNGKTVTKIASEAFSDITLNSSITIVKIPKTIQEIESNAFRRCKNLQQVIIEEGLNSIGDYAFAGCINISRINFPESLKNIGAMAFSDCKNIETNLRFENIEKIGAGAFQELDISYLHLPKIVEIGALAFSNCTNLTEVVIGDNIKSVDNSAFEGCPIVSAKLPAIATCCVRNEELKNVVVTCGDVLPATAFYDCKNLAEVTLPASIVKIGESAFSGCEKLTNIDLPENLEVMEGRVFVGCSFTDIYIPDEVKRLGDNTFLASKLEKIHLPNNLEYIGKYCFADCTGLQELIFPDGVKVLDAHALDGCNNLIRIVLSESLTNVFGYGSFNDCRLLEYNIYNGLKYLGTENNPYYLLAGYLSSPGDVSADEMFHKDTRVVADYTNGHIINSPIINLPEGLKSLGNNSLGGLHSQSIKTINLPESLTYFGDSIFCYLSGVESMTIPKNVAYIGTDTLPRNLKNVYVDESNKVYKSIDGKKIVKIETGEVIFECNTASE